MVNPRLCHPPPVTTRRLALSPPCSVLLPSLLDGDWSTVPYVSSGISLQRLPQMLFSAVCYVPGSDSLARRRMMSFRVRGAIALPFDQHTMTRRRRYGTALLDSNRTTSGSGILTDPSGV